MDNPNDFYGPPRLMSSQSGLTYLAGTTKTPFIEMYLTAFVSACCAEIVGFPFDLCKIRMQIQGEVASAKGGGGGAPPAYRGLLATGLGVIREEGLLHLYSGMSAMVFRHSIFTGLKMSLYDYLRQKLKVVDSNGNESLPFARGAVCGLCAGAGANMVSSPTDLIRVQMQMEGKRKLMGLPPRVTNVFQALGHIYGKGGIRGLWRGVIPNCVRASLVTMGDVSCYDQSKRFLKKTLNSEETRMIQFGGAMVAGFMGAFLATPADVIKSRIMNQPTDDKGRPLHYKSAIDCMTKLIREEGFMAMYKGFLPFWLRVGPWAMVFWTTFEQIRRMRGTQTF